MPRTAHSRQETVLQQPTGGTPRPDAASTDRDQAPATPPVHRLTGRASRALRDRVRARAATVGDVLRTALRPFTSAERALPIAVASIVAVAALLAFLPTTPQGAVAGIQGSTATNLRLAVNGGVSRDQQLQSALGALNAADGASATKVAASTPDPSFQPLDIPVEVSLVAPSAGPEPTDGPLANISAPQASTGPAITPAPEDLNGNGTLIAGYAPDTRVEDGSDLVRNYTVQKGDTVRSVAKKFGVSSMTLWWANKLKKSSLKAGAELRIPPVSGLVYTVKDTDTLASVAKRFKIDSAKVVTLNGLEDPTLVVGQVLILPGAKGPPKPTPKPTPKPSSSVKVASGGGGVLSGGPANYGGGAMRWPVIGGGNYISQYFHYGHYALDIAADYGSKVVASAGGKVIFAGWKSNGGGYQVWISHGSNLYTTYNHMSAITVSRGENVSRGEQVGRIGASGLATGPHCHFEVWVGRIWDGGTRVNPLKYF